MVNGTAADMTINLSQPINWLLQDADGSEVSLKGKSFWDAIAAIFGAIAESAENKLMDALANLQAAQDSDQQSFSAALAEFQVASEQYKMVMKALDTATSNIGEAATGQTDNR